MFTKLRLYFYVNDFNYLIPRRYAGHNKWSNIRHIKAEKDGEKAAIFSRITRAMEVAIKEKGNADPESNVKLAQALEQAKKANMPSSSVQNILKRLQNEGEKKYHTLEIKGPKGSAFIVCLMTSNLTLHKTNINVIIKRSNGVFSYGNMLHLFTQKGIIKADLHPGSSLEEAIDHALKLELDDVEESEIDGKKYLEFTCNAIQLKIKEQQLKDMKYAIESTEIVYIPHLRVAVSDQDIQSINWLYTKLQDISDIIDIYDNIVES